MSTARKLDRRAFLGAAAAIGAAGLALPALAQQIPTAPAAFWQSMAKR